MRKQQVLDLVLGGNQRVEFSRLFVLDGFLLERYSPLAQQRLTVNPQMVQMTISLTNMNANKLLMSVQGFNEFSTNEQAMTSDHNSSELGIHDFGIHDYSNEPSSSKLVPKVVPPAVKTATSRQELELLFQNHITMLRTQSAIRNTVYGSISYLTTSYHDDSERHKAWVKGMTDKIEAITGTIHNNMVLVMSLDGVVMPIQLKSDYSLPHAHAQSTKTILYKIKLRGDCSKLQDEAKY
ncbi:hypothetical protein Tco_1302759 [Tanacetum coccineum]